MKKGEITLKSWRGGFSVAIDSPSLFLYQPVILSLIRTHVVCTQGTAHPHADAHAKRQKSNLPNQDFEKKEMDRERNKMKGDGAKINFNNSQQRD